MIEYARFFIFYRSALMRSVRLLIVSLLLVVVFSHIAASTFPRIPLFLLHVFVMFEIFFRFKISNIMPVYKVTDTHDTPIEYTMTRAALVCFLKASSIKHLLQLLVRKKQVSFLLEKATIEEYEIPLIDLKKDALLTATKELVVRFHGDYITTMDLMASYLLLVDKEKRFLFDKHITPEQLIRILYWARFDFMSFEHPVHHFIHFDGSGLGNSLISGWTVETKKYTTDWSLYAFKKRPLLMGRQEEYKRMIQALSKTENNNVLLVGEMGVGKESILTALAWDSYIGHIPQNLQYKKILQVNVGPLLAGASNQGELEKRLDAIIQEVSHAKNIILYIPEFQNVLGSSSFHLDISGVLLPYMKDGTLPVVATVSKGNYKAFVEESPVKQAFDVIPIEEPSIELALLMLFEKASDIEQKYGVSLPYKSIAKAVQIADRYLTDMVLPGSAVTLLEDVCAEVALSPDAARNRKKRKIVTEEKVIQLAEQKTHVAIGAPDRQEKDLLLHLEEKLHERVVDQKDAIHAVSEAVRRIRADLSSHTRPISFLFLGPTGVGKTETAKALAQLYFGGEERMIRLDMSEYVGNDGVKRLLGAPPGKGNERGELTEKIHDNPFSLVLLDEFEKAHPVILDLFLQVLEDGRLTDNKGRTVSFVNAILIATSNAGSEFIREEIIKGGKLDSAFEPRLIDYLQKNHIFKPELLNRFDNIVTFMPLGEAEIKGITKLLLRNVIEKMKEKEITVIFDDELIAKIVKEGFDPQFGARPIRRYIQEVVEDFIAKKQLSDELVRGSTITLGIDEHGEIVMK